MSELFKIKIKDSSINGMAFSDKGVLGVASSDGCAYFFNRNGELIRKDCGPYSMNTISYSSDRFGYINGGEYLYIADSDGQPISEMSIGAYQPTRISMASNGYLICGGGKCYFFEFGKGERWKVSVWSVANNPSHYKSYWYIADPDIYSVLIVKDGKVVEQLSYGAYDSQPYGTAVCGKYLAVATDSYLFLYDLSDPADPERIWRAGGLEGGWEVAFSSDCRYIAVADRRGKKLKIFNIAGASVQSLGFNTYITAVAWRNDRIAVGLYNGEVIVYNVLAFKLFFPLA